jgi:hypothetical protein
MVYYRMGYTRRNGRRGGGKFTSPYPSKNKNTTRGAKTGSLMPKVLKYKSNLKTIKKSKTTVKKTVTADKYLEGILKFLNKILRSSTDRELYDYAGLQIQSAIVQYFSSKGVNLEETSPEEVYDFIERLERLLSEMIEEFTSLNYNNERKIDLEYEMEFLANMLMKIIKDSKDFYRDYIKTAPKNVGDELADLLGAMSIKKEVSSKKNNKSVEDLAALFGSKMGLL